MKKEDLKEKIASLIQSEGLYNILDAIVTIAYDQSDILPKDNKMGDWWYAAAEAIYDVNKVLSKQKPSRY